MVNFKYLIIPFRWHRKRFKKENYKNPKALISLTKKCIIYWLLDNQFLVIILF